MKSRIPVYIDGKTRRAVKELVLKDQKQYQTMITRRLFLAVILALNDISGWGDIRCGRLINALAEIIEGYGVFNEHMTKNMEQELAERGLTVPDALKEE